MFSERWLCFCCPPMNKPPRRQMVAPIEETHRQPDTSPHLRPYRGTYREKKRSDLSTCTNR